MTSYAFDEYQYQRKFILSALRQVRIMVRDGRQIAEGKALIKREQAAAAKQRARAYGCHITPSQA